MLKKAASFVLASLGSSGRLTISAARTNVVLLIRRTVRPSTYTMEWMEQTWTGCGRATGKTRVLARVGRAGWNTAFLTILLSCLFSVSSLPAAEKTAGHLSVQDVLVLPGQPARIEAILTTSSLLGTPLGLGGEQLELVVDGKAVAKTMTGGDGRGYLEYTPQVRGNHEVTVRLAPNPRVTGPPATAVLGAWERRRPILLVEVASLVQPDKASPLPVPSMPIPLSGKEDSLPAPDAAAELSRLTQFFYNVMYVSWSPRDGESPTTGNQEDVREWLARHKFPRGLSVRVDPGRRGLGEKIEQLRADGWKNVKAGIGRRTEFAEILVEHRMDVVIVPVPDRDELPRKAKAVNSWKEIRTKL